MRRPKNVVLLAERSVMGERVPSANFCQKSSTSYFWFQSIREDTQRKSVLFNGRTSKGVGRVNPP